MTDSNGYNIIVAICRVLAAYLLFNAALDMTYIPDGILSLLHYFRGGAAAFSAPSADVIY